MLRSDFLIGRDRSRSLCLTMQCAIARKARSVPSLQSLAPANSGTSCSNASTKAGSKGIAWPNSLVPDSPRSTGMGLATSSKTNGALRCSANHLSLLKVANGAVAAVEPDSMKAVTNAACPTGHFGSTPKVAAYRRQRSHSSRAVHTPLASKVEMFLMPAW